MTQEETILEDKGREANHDLSFREWNRSKHAQYFTPMRMANLLYAMTEAAIRESHGTLQTYQHILKRLNVLDPTVGTGRLLYPFKRKEANVLGVELDDAQVEKARMLLGKEAVRHGSILDYAKYFDGDAAGEWDMAVTNPPYGLTWSQSETDFQFASVSQAGNIESQDAVIQIISRALRYEGLMFAIIPTSTFENGKDERLRQSLYSSFDILLRVTTKNLFKEEYGIPVEVDLVVGRNKWTNASPQIAPAPRYQGSHYKTQLLSLDWNNKDFEKETLAVWIPIAKGLHFRPQSSSSRSEGIPHLDNLVEIDVGANAGEITAKGFSGGLLDNALMDFHDKVANYYCPVFGKPTGLKTAFLERPALFTRGTDPALRTLLSLGYNVTVTPEAKAAIDEMTERYKVLTTPIYRPKDHQRLAYFEEREYTAKADVYDDAKEAEYRQDHRDNGQHKVSEENFARVMKYASNPTADNWDDIHGLILKDSGNTIWQEIGKIDPSFPKHGRSRDRRDHIINEWEKLPDPSMVLALVTHQPTLLFKAGKKYYLRPSWVRQSEDVGQEIIKEGNKDKVITTSIDRGFLAIEANTEQGLRPFREPESLEVATLLEAFELPEVKDIADVAPEKVKAWKKKLMDKYPNIFTSQFEYQAEDLARILTKMKSAYLGYDMGGGKTCVSMVFTAIRGIKRTLVVCQSSLIENWINEAEKFGFKAQRLTTHRAIDALQKEMRAGIKPKEPTFYLISYEFLSLDTGRFYDPWDCIKYDKDGEVRHEVQGNRTRTCRDCSTEFMTTSHECPKCKEVDRWTGKYCPACGYSAYTYSSKDAVTQYPAYRRIKKLFGAVIIDEAQAAKSKTSFRGQACRAIKAPSRLVLTGTLMKGYITDTFYNVGFICRHNNPLFPYRFDGRGSKAFAEEFSTFEYKDIEFENTLHKGRKKQLPEVSNLNRFWKILSAFAIRRLKDDMIKLPAKHRRIIALNPSGAHAAEYAEAALRAKEIIEKELRKPHAEVNMGAISKAIWGMRFAAAVPKIDPELNVKIQKAVSLAKEARDRGEKVLVYSALRDMQGSLHEAFRKAGIEHFFIPSSVPTHQRFSWIKKFQEDPAITCIVAGLNVLNRGFTITAANNVIFTDVEFSPEPTDQAEDRPHRTGQQKPVTCYYLLMDWEEEKANIDFRMFNLITQKKKAISNAIDGKVRFANTAKVLSAGGDYLAIARTITGKQEEPLEFEVERQDTTTTTPEAPTIVIKKVEAQDSGLWEKLYREVQQMKEERRKGQAPRKTEGQMNLF